MPSGSFRRGQLCTVYAHCTCSVPAASALEKTTMFTNNLPLPCFTKQLIDYQRETGRSSLQISLTIFPTPPFDLLPVKLAGSDSLPKILFPDSEKKQWHSCDAKVVKHIFRYIRVRCIIEQIKSIPHVMWKRGPKCKITFARLWQYIVWECVRFFNNPLLESNWSLQPPKGYAVKMFLMEWQHCESTNQSERWETVGEPFLHSAAKAHLVWIRPGNNCAQATLQL